jgi:tetratricopeptide (TPR) repeat protein
MQDGPGEEEEEEEREVPEGVAAAAGRADAIMETLAEMLAADGPDPDGPDLEDALRSADDELASLESCFDPTPWLLPALDCYRGAVRQELWERLGDRADLDAACELLLSGVLGPPEPDPDDVFSLLQALADRLRESPSAGDRDIFIGWGSWLFSQPDVTGQPDDQPDGPSELELLLREQLALQLLDRVESGDGDRTADLDAVIAHYEVLVAASPPGQPERAELLGMLVHACWDRVDGDAARQAEVDRLVRHAREARTAPGLPADVRGLIGLYLGVGLYEQFRRPDWKIDRGDVDLAVSSLSEIGPDVRAEPNVAPLVDTHLGLLLVSRGQMLGSAADLAAAEPFLVRAAGALEHDNPDLSEIAYSLAVAECVLANLGHDLAHSDQAIRLLRAAGERPSAEPDRAAMIHLGLGTLLLGRVTGERGPAADEGIGHLTVAFQLAPVGSPTRLMAASNLGSALATRFYTTGDRQDLQAARFYLDILDEARSAAASGGVADLVAGPDAITADVDLMAVALRARIAMARGLDRDPAGLDEAVEALRTAVGLAGPGHPWAGGLRSDLGLALTLRFDYGRRDPADLEQGVTELEAAADLIPAGHLMRPMALVRAVSARWLLARGGGDQRQMRDAIARLIELRAAAVGGPGDPSRLTAMLALMHGDLYPMTGIAADLAATRHWFAQAAAEFERQPGHPNHGQLLIALARLERRIGDNQAAVRSGLAALRIRARDALLQTGPAHGLATARIAAAEAAEIAGWCLADGATGLAVEALELGRGLVLHAATSAADMPERLERAGRQDLAAEWRRRAGEDARDQPWDAAGGPRDTLRHLLEGESLAVPSDLRERALNALDADVLVTPPDHGEIAAALTRTGADALVYLLPATDDAPGRALIVPADGGRPREVPLPQLRTSAALDRYEAAQARLLTVAHTAADEDEWGRQLGLLCGWAWTSVVRPLLAELGPGAAGGPPRLVLVPIGRLGLVPWHAARRPAPTAAGWRYAITDAVFSYAASGRQLAEVSRRPALPLAGDPVIVAPLNDLQLMHREASALRERYPNARYLGFSLDRPVDDLATPDAVLGVLPARDRAGASLLHLVCHGVATSAGADASYLVLEDEQALSVKAILRQAHGRPTGAPGGLVDLVACRTDVTPADYDEALTLATAFLAAGAVTVVGSGWKIPESSSAVLMFMFHHFLAVEACPPRDALRRAQLWMADPGRVPPASMPAGLRKALAVNGPWALDDVLAWAGLTHQGQ